MSLRSFCKLAFVCLCLNLESAFAIDTAPGEKSLEEAQEYLMETFQERVTSETEKIDLAGFTGEGKLAGKKPGEAFQKFKELIPYLLPLEKLTILRASHARCKKLPRSIGLLKHLRTLDLSFNSLETLPPELGLLRELTNLSLYGNNLKELPTCVKDLSKLGDLSLGLNKLEKLPHWIGVFQKLYRLGLQGNPSLKNLPNSIGCLPRLRSLDLVYTSAVEILPESMLEKMKKGRYDFMDLDVSAPCFNSKKTPNISSHRGRILPHVPSLLNLAIYKWLSELSIAYKASAKKRINHKEFIDFLKEESKNHPSLSDDLKDIISGFIEELVVCNMPECEGILSRGCPNKKIPIWTNVEYRHVATCGTVFRDRKDAWFERSICQMHQDESQSEI